MAKMLLFQFVTCAFCGKEFPMKGIHLRWVEGKGPFYFHSHCEKIVEQHYTSAEDLPDSPLKDALIHG